MSRQINLGHLHQPTPRLFSNGSPPSTDEGVDKLGNWEVRLTLEESFTPLSLIGFNMPPQIDDETNYSTIFCTISPQAPTQYSTKS
jgi:hypothetical protein